MTNSTANVYQDGAGHLVIKPIRDGAGNWTSGRIETQRTDFAAPAGGKLRLEASLQQPNVSGAAAAGYWPAFWSLGAAARGVGASDWPGIGEIDLMEDINGRQLRVRHPPLWSRAGRAVQRDHRPRQRRARLRRLPDRLPHLRHGVRPQRLARADPLVPRRHQLLHRQRQPGRRDHLEQRHPPRLLHDPERGDRRRLPGRVRRRPDRLHPVRRADAASTTSRCTPAAAAARHRRRGKAITDYATGCAWTTGPSSTANGNPIQIWTCNGTGAQQWTVVEAGSTLHVLGKCLDIAGGGTANGTLVDLCDCNNTGAQVWIPQSNGSLLQPAVRQVPRRHRLRPPPPVPRWRSGTATAAPTSGGCCRPDSAGAGCGQLPRSGPASAAGTAT